MSKKDWTDSQWDIDGSFDLEATIDDREPRKDPIPPNPPPKKVGKIDPKTIAGRAVSDLIDCGSWKTQAVMQFYIDSANRKNGHCYPSEETVAHHLGLRDPQAVKRANRFWKRYGAKGVPFLSVARKGRRKPDGTKESNAYHVGWIPLITLVAECHWNAKLRREARAVLASVSSKKAANEQF